MFRAYGISAGEYIFAHTCFVMVESLVAVAMFIEYFQNYLPGRRRHGDKSPPRKVRDIERQRQHVRVRPEAKRLAELIQQQAFTNGRELQALNVCLHGFGGLLKGVQVLRGAKSRRPASRQCSDRNQ
jgi:hypothetical protein